MIDGYIVDSNGFMLEPIVNLPDGTQNDSIINGQTVIVTRCQDGLYKPQWNGAGWVEGADAATLLSNAKKAKQAELDAALQATLSGGFTSKVTGHTYVTTTNGEANMEGDLKRFELDTTLASVQFYTADAGWIAHSHQDLINAFLDGGKWKDAQYAQRGTLKANVANASTIDAVNAITWSTASY